MTRWVVGDLVTGRLTGQLGESTGSWSDVLNQPGSVQCAVGLAQYDNPTPGGRPILDVRNKTIPWRSYIGAVGPERVYNAGPIIARPWDDDTQTLTVAGAGMWAYLFRRVLRPALAPGQRLSDEAVTTAYTLANGTAKSLGGIVVSVIAQMIAVGSVPIDLPGVEAGVNERTYPGYDAALVGDRVKQITEVLNGPDVVLEPYLASPQFMRWRLKVGTTADPFIHSSGRQVFDYTAPRTNSSGLAIQESSARVTGMDFEMGGGQSDEVVAGMAYDPWLQDHGWPLLESVRSLSTVSELQTLDDYAAERVRLGRNTTEAWTLKFNTRERPFPSSYTVGDFAYLRIRGHRWIPDSSGQPNGMYSVRIVGLAGTHNDSEIAVTFQEET